ncbi:hypothetical protein DACRYDRAFT_23283 [Dacryopinax primogenitus]|uniref:Uncharacterized protein n=1 Tax=Dacryopinax primogenitus (strain DJM 731) TaxID=1858805 RepID=M5G3D9_DACPD|nr:uncharacterized protein DACRYDRAFT_23283 [Dacryopinax primogenitus]EJU00392.1 hypothetical protein DACRYDRAFT_23283 [Dacryopinax primogenitus]
MNASRGSEADRYGEFILSGQSAAKIAEVEPENRGTELRTMSPPISGYPLWTKCVGDWMVRATTQGTAELLDLRRHGEDQAAMGKTTALSHFAPSCTS